jgi:hypothetical protein
VIGSTGTGRLNTAPVTLLSGAHTSIVVPVTLNVLAKGQPKPAHILLHEMRRDSVPLLEYVAYEDIKHHVLQYSGSTDTTEEATFCQRLKKNRIKKRFVPAIDRLIVTGIACAASSRKAEGMCPDRTWTLGGAQGCASLQTNKGSRGPRHGLTIRSTPD